MIDQRYQQYKAEVLKVVYCSIVDGNNSIDGNVIQFIIGCDVDTVSRVTDELLAEGRIKVHETEAGYIPA